MKLSQQENQVLGFLSSRQEVYWEELVQFCKNPALVKLKTIKKIVSDLKKKYRENNVPAPFNCSFKLLGVPSEQPKMIQTDTSVDFNGQKLVQVKRTIVAHSKPNTTPIQHEPSTHQQVMESIKSIVPDFTIKNYTRQVLTKSGMYALNDDEFELFNYFYNNPNRFVSLEELRDRVCYPKYGSKLPARWFSAIQRRIGNIRHHIPETRNRLLTAKQNANSGYIFN